MDDQTNINQFASEFTWAKYNRAKCSEKRMFYVLLDELCSLIKPQPHITGRPPIPLKDLLFCACLKVYSNFSARKISSDMKHAQEAGYIQKVPHFNSLLVFMNDHVVEQLLKKFITISAMPLKELETDFAVDSSGFGCYQYERWMKIRFGQHENPEKLWRNYVKAHVSIGTKTNVITSVEVTEGFSGDSPEFPRLVQQTVANFNVKRYSADKAYLSTKNLQIAQALDFLPFIPFKINSAHSNKNAPLWNHMYKYFNENRAEFDRFYHRRSNVESTFAMIKTRLGEFLRCRNIQGQKNEVLLKCLVHNICCLVQEIFESGIKIDFDFCDKNYVAHKEN
ncbi:transposase [Candidatus Pacearchaeota archaeon]|nr:transposase [Candidatus Pacearchaeota archaeon]